MFFTMPSSTLRQTVTFYCIAASGVLCAAYACALAFHFLGWQPLSADGRLQPGRVGLLLLASAAFLALAWHYRKGRMWVVKLFTLAIMLLSIAGGSTSYDHVITQSCWIGVLLAVALTSLRWTLVVAFLSAATILLLWRDAGAWQTGATVLMSSVTLLVVLAGRAIQDSAVASEQEAHAKLRLFADDLERRVAQRTDELSAANATLQETVAKLERTRNTLVRVEEQVALGRLMAGVAHELNTPLGNARLASSALAEQTRVFRAELDSGNVRRSSVQALVDCNQDACAIIERSLHRSAQLIDGFKQISGGLTSEPRVVFALQELLAPALAVWQPQLLAHGARLELEVAESLRLHSYPQALLRIVEHLLSNALTHGLEGRADGVVRVSAESPDNERVLLRVLDNGRGFAPALREKLFEPFVTTRFGQGTSGIGLHLCHVLARQLLGGGISADNRPEGGAVFTLDIPRRSPDAVVLEAAA